MNTEAFNQPEPAIDELVELAQAVKKDGGHRKHASVTNTDPNSPSRIISAGTPPTSI